MKNPMRRERIARERGIYDKEKERVCLGCFVSRVEFLSKRASGKKVLHCGCSSGRYLRDRVKRKSLFHEVLRRVSDGLYGLDIDAESVKIMSEEMGYENLYVGDVEKLDDLDLSETFDLVVAGDLLEHLTRPGAMLDGIKRFLSKDSEVIVSTNNAFGLHYQLKRWLGRYSEQFEHVCFYSPETLVHLFERHGYSVREIYGAYTEEPYSTMQLVKFSVGAPVFRLFPVLSGTILVVAVANGN